MPGLLPPEPTNHLPLHKHSEALVKPEVFPLAVGDQVARPGVADFMNYYISQGSVTCLLGGGGGEDMVKKMDGMYR